MKKPFQPLLLVILLLPNYILAQLPGYVPVSNLVGWYGFNGSGNDASTAANHLTNYGATLTTDRYNVANAAYQYNGTTQYMQRLTPSYTFGQASSFSISWWMYRATAGYGVALMHGTTTNTNFIWNFQTNANTDVMFGANKQGSAWTWAQTPYTSGQWVHLVATFDNGTITLYKNGVQVTTASFPHTGSVQTTLPLWIGRGVGGAYFAGKIDDIGIWTRVLTLAEIQALYSGCDATLNTQPADVNATYGSNAAFGVGVTGTGVNYLWQSNIGSGWQNIPNSGQYSGVFTDTLLVSNVTMINNNQLFRCIISQGTNCGDTSDQAELLVCGEITQDPDDTTIFINFGAQFAANSSDPSASFAWQTDAGSGWSTLTNGGQFTGVTTKTMAINTVTMANDGQEFRCLVTSGDCTDTTDSAELTVIDNIGIDENTGASGLNIYPNPVKELLTVQVLSAMVNRPYTIIDQTGRCVAAGSITNVTTIINVSALAPGIYVLRMGQGSTKTFVILP